MGVYMPNPETKNEARYVKWGGDFGGRDSQLEHYMSQEAPATKPAEGDVAKEKGDRSGGDLGSATLPSAAGRELRSIQPAQLEVSGPVAELATTAWRSAYGSAIAAIETLEVFKPNSEQLSTIKVKLSNAITALTTKHDATKISLNPETLESVAGALTDLRTNFTGGGAGDSTPAFASALDRLSAHCRNLQSVAYAANPGGDIVLKVPKESFSSAKYWQQTLIDLAPRADAELPPALPKSEPSTPATATTGQESKQELKDSPAAASAESKPKKESSHPPKELGPRMLSKLNTFIEGTAETRANIESWRQRLGEIKEVLTDTRQRISEAMKPENDKGWMAVALRWMPAPVANLVRAYKVSAERTEVKERKAEQRQLKSSISRADQELVRSFRDKFGGIEFTLPKENPEKIPGLAIRASIPAEKVGKLLSFGRLADEIAEKHPDAAIEIDRRAKTIRVHHENGNVLVYKHRSDGKVSLYARMSGAARDAEPEFIGSVWTDDVQRAVDKFIRKGDLTFTKRHWENRVIPRPDFLDTVSTAPKARAAELKASLASHPGKSMSAA